MYSQFQSVGDGCRPVSLKSLVIPATPSITVLAPHPDDFDAIGVTMQLFKTNGNHINVAVLTSGASGVENGFCGASTDEAKGLLREKEQQASVHFFGLPENQLSFLHLSEDNQGHPENSTANRELIRSYLVAKNPQFVFLPHGNDTNPGHRLTHAFLRQILDEEKPSVIAFLNRDPKTISMRQDLYTEFGTEASNWKSELLRFHQSQHQRNLNHRGHGFDQRIMQLNRQIAVELNTGDSYAEAFELEFFGPSFERRT